MGTSVSSILPQTNIKFSVTYSRQGFKTTKNFKTEADAERFCSDEIAKGHKIIKKIRWHK